MDSASIAKNIIGLQKQSFNSFFDTMILFQDQAEKTRMLWANRMGISENSQKLLDQWREVLIKSREDSRKFINEGFTSLEDYFTALEQKKPAEKKKPAGKKKTSGK
jgi:hypothetical protein